MSIALSAEIFAIGTELLNGLVQDSNSFWLARELALLGCEVCRITVLADDPEAMAEGLKGAIGRGTRVVTTSGGLGATPDDMTVEVVARMLGVRPVVHEGIVQELMQRQGIKDRGQLRPALLRMARVPAGARAYPNPVGVGPCIHVEHGKTNLFLLPGPPREMQAVFQAYLKPFVQAMSPFKVVSHRVVVNMLEAEVGSLLQEVMRAYPGTYLKGALTQAVRVGDTQHLPVDVVCKGETTEGATAKLAQALRLLEQLLSQRGYQVVSR